MTDLTGHRPTYTARKPDPPETSEQLRARIPGWGADLDPADRPAVPRERFDPGATGAHWDFPERQPETAPRERSVEHAFLTPVFGTAAPLKGVSGALRRYSYARFSEARAAHWLLLIAADRVDAWESHLRPFTTPGRTAPLNPLEPRTWVKSVGQPTRITHVRAERGRPSQAQSAPTTSRKVAVCRSTSARDVCGHMSAMLWNGVMRMPRLHIARCR
jgi:hypothetical protein